MLPVEELCQRTKDCFGYSFEFRYFMKFLMMRMRLLEQVRTVLDTEQQIRYASLAELPLESACMIQRKYPVHVYKEVSKKKLKELNERLEDICMSFMQQLIYQNLYKEIESLTASIVAMIVGNQPWEQIYGILAEYLEPERLGDYGIRYHLSRLYLNLPRMNPEDLLIIENMEDEEFGKEDWDGSWNGLEGQ